MIVDEIEDLNTSAVAQLPMGEIGLPGFIRLGCFKADIGRAGTFAWLGLDEAIAGENLPDGGDGRGAAEFKAQVVGDGVGTGIESLLA